MDKELEKVIHSISLETYTEKSKIREVVDSYFKIIFEEMKKGSVDENIEFTSVLLQHIGRIYVPDKRIEAIRKHNESKSKISKDQQENT